MKNKLLATTSALFLAILGIIILPSQYYSGDMVIHLQFIKQIENPSLFAKDYTNKFLTPQRYSSIYYPAISWLTSVLPFNLYTDLRLLYFLSMVIFFLGILRVALELNGSYWVGIIWSLLLLFNVHIGGAAIETIETDLVPRGISIGVTLWSFIYFLKREYKISFLLAGLSIAVHVLTGFYTIFFYLLYLLFTFIRKRQYLLLSLFLSTALVLLIVSTYKWPLSGGWLEILRFRNNYAFYDLWSLAAWRNLVTLLVPGIIGFFWLSNKWVKAKPLFVFLFVGVGLLSTLHIIFAILYPSWWMVVLQVGRSWIYVVYISLFLAAGLISEKMNNFASRIGLMYLLGTVVVLFNLYYRSPRQLTQWVDVQHWGQTNTNINCIFLIPFYIPGFRVESERGITGDIKDGTLSFYSEDFAHEWKKRYTDLSNWETFSHTSIHNLQKEYKFNYLVVNKPTKYDLPLRYENEKFAVYYVTSSELCQEN